jgi:hypothetical protein
MGSVYLANTTKGYGGKMDKTTLSEQLKDLFEACAVDYDVDAQGVPNGGYRMQKPVAPRATFMDDPLALSCASYRIFQAEPARRFTNIDTVKATQEDRTMAQQIRDYYNARYTMKALKGQTLTPYQQKTAQFLSGLHHLTTEELGLLYKLPYFYVEDRALELVAEETTDFVFKLPRNNAVEEYTLTPVIEILKSRKGSEYCEFVYRDQNNHAVMIRSKASDPIGCMLRGLFKQPSIQVKGHSKVIGLDTVDPHHARVLTLWELVL